MIQGLKLTFLGRRQEATDTFFFSRHVEKYGRQKAEKKGSIKFFLRSETQTKILGCQMENSGCQFFSFKNQNEENAFTFGAPVAIYTPSTEKPRRMNRMPAIYAVS